MSPEVQASIIKAASDWAIVLSRVGDTKEPKHRIPLLHRRFEESYMVIRKVLKEYETK